jgi:spore germination protein YaaH
VAATGLKQYPLIDCHAGIDSVRLMMNTTAKRKAFITAAVAKMQAQKFDGYNLDIEIGGSPADAVFYTQFVKEFADALHAAGGLLSSDSKLLCIDRVSLQPPCCLRA